VTPDGESTCGSLSPHAPQCNSSPLDVQRLLRLYAVSLEKW